MDNKEQKGNNLGGAILKKPRSSNLELYRIVCMLMIVAHHYVVNSGLTAEGGPLLSDFSSSNSFFILLFGAWGKTGINCFLMITGYFMCTSKITLRKFIKLMGQIYLYKTVIYLIMLFAGYETLSILRIVKLAMPTWGFTRFIGSFIAFWLTIPYLNILVQNMTKRQHEMMILLLVVMFTLLGSIPTFKVPLNYVSWFGVIYIIASYIRMYPCRLFERKIFWGWLTLITIIMAMISIVVMGGYGGKGGNYSYFFVADCNKIFSVAVAVCSFLWFKNLDINYSKTVNAFGAATFGVLLIHANSDAMRTWLWKDLVDVVSHYQTLGIYDFIIYSIGVVITIFVICNLIDQLRIATLEKCFFGWYDKKMSAKADGLLNRIIS